MSAVKSSVITENNISNGLKFDADNQTVLLNIKNDEKILSVGSDGISSTLNVSFDSDTKEVTLKGISGSQIGEAASLDAMASLEDLSDLHTTVTGEINDLANGAVKNNTDAIAVINGDDTKDGSIKKSAKDTLKTAKDYTDEQIGNLTKADVGLDLVENEKIVVTSNSVSSTNKGGTTTTFTKYVHPTYTATDASAKKVGLDSTGHVVLGDALTKADVGLSNVNNTNITVSATEGIKDNTNNVTYKYVHPTKPTALTPAAVKVAVDNNGHAQVGDALTKADVGLDKVVNQAITVTNNSVTDGTNTFTKYTHPTYTQKAAAPIKVGVDSTGHVVAGDTLTHSDISGLGDELDKKLNLTGGTLTGDLTLDQSELHLINGNFRQSTTNDETLVANLSEKNSFLQAEVAVSNEGVPYGNTPYSCTGCKGWCIIGLNVSNKTLTLRGNTSALTSYKGTDTKFSIALAQTSSSRFGSITNIVASGDTSAIVTLSNIPSSLSSYESYTKEQLEDLFINDDNAFYLADKPDLGPELIRNFYGNHAEGGSVKAIGKYTHSEGRNCIADVRYSHAEGSHCFAGGMASHAEGFGCQAIGDKSHASGNAAIAKNEHDCSFVWSYIDYTTQAKNSFCVNPAGGSDGFFIGTNSLTAIIQQKSSAKFSDTDTADLSNDDGIVLAIKAILMKMGMKESNITMP